MRLPTAVPQASIERLDALLRRDPQRAKVEMLKHLDGDLMIVPRPSSPRRAAGRDQRPAQRATAS